MIHDVGLIIASSLFTLILIRFSLKEECFKTISPKFNEPDLSSEKTHYREALQKILCSDPKWSRDIAKRALDHFKP